MSHGGRIRSHEKHYLSDKKAMILFVGYQAVGTLGRRILDGEKKVRIDGDYIRIRAEVRAVHGYSAHKDMDHILEFIEGGQETLEKVFVAMGEPKTELFLTQRIRDFVGLDAVAPGQNEKVTISL